MKDARVNIEALAIYFLISKSKNSASTSTALPCRRVFTLPAPSGACLKRAFVGHNPVGAVTPTGRVGYPTMPLATPASAGHRLGGSRSRPALGREGGSSALAPCHPLCKAAVRRQSYIYMLSCAGAASRQKATPDRIVK